MLLRPLLLLQVLPDALERAADALLPPPPRPPQPSHKHAHLETVLRVVLPWATPAATAIAAAQQAAGGGEERLLAACRCLLAAARVHRAAGFDAASAALGLAGSQPGGGQHGGGLLGLLGQLTTAVLAACPPGSDPGLGWEGEAAELLLECWVELVADPCRGPLGTSQASVAAAAAVFGAVMEQGLAQAAAEALEDEGGPQAGTRVQGVGVQRRVCEWNLGM